jgi:hypothetical protein
MQNTLKMDFVVSFKCNKIQLKNVEKEGEAYSSHKDSGNKQQNGSIVRKISMVILHYIQ